MADVTQIERDPDTGDMIIRPAAPAVHNREAVSHFGNLSTAMTEHRRAELSSMVTEHVTYDDSSRSDWEAQLARNTELLGIGPESKPDENEYENSDTSDHPLLLTALTRFQSKALSMLMPHPEQVCNYKPALDLELIDDEAAKEAAQTEADAAGRRVQRFYADFLLNKHPSYVEDTDMILADNGLNGCGLRKIYNDPSRPGLIKTQIERARLQDVIISYDTTSWRCGRITHRMQVPTPDLIRLIRGGVYRPVPNLSETGDGSLDALTVAQDRIRGMTRSYMQGTGSHKVYETRLDLFLEEDEHPMGLARPYIMTIHAATQEVLAIRRNWVQGDEEENRVEQFVAYLFHPGGASAVYGLGLGQILGNITLALRRAQRRALDAAYLANHPSGFKLSTFKIRDDAAPIRPGEFVDIEAATDDVRKALMLHPFEGPNQGLLALADKLEQNGRELGGIASIDFAQLMKAGIAAGPAMAAYEESTEFQTAIHRRLYDAQASEYRLIHARVRECCANKPVPFGTNGQLRPGDLTKVDIIPFMKPGQASRQKVLLEAQAIYDISKDMPDIVDRRKAAEDFLRALGKPDIDRLLLPDPADNPPQPLDPVSEYASILAGKAVRAGPIQNHRAHIDAHAAQMRGLQNSQLPVEQGDAAMAALSAHIAEHMGLDLMTRVAAMVGIPLEQLGENMPPEIEAQIAPAIAQAVVMIEQERAAAAEAVAQDKAAAEAIKGQNAMQLQDLKGAQAIELEREKRKTVQLREEHADEREEADNETALAIAKLKGAPKPSGDAGARTGAPAGASSRADA